MFSALIIDGDTGVQLIRRALEPFEFEFEFEFEFTSTSDADEAVRLACTTPPDIIFLQVELPKAASPRRPASQPL